MKKNILFATLCLFLSLAATAQTYRTATLTERIRTLQVHNSNSWDQAPIIELNSMETVDISFDLLSASREFYTYRIIHCDADWRPSQLSESEYMTGLQYNYIDDYANSFNTQPDYVNYRLTLPNEYNQLTVSGNYAVEVLGEDGEAVLHACLSVVEPIANIRMSVSSITDKGVNNRYQAVKLEVAYGKEVRTPAQDLKVFVQQNNRLDNQAALIKPMGLQSGKAVYDHSPALVFNAGNEYRVFEMTTAQYTGLNIESIEFHSPFYHVLLFPSAIRANRSYMFQHDINGRVYIRSQYYDDSATESDYHIVHFYLPCDAPFADNVYILSEAFNNILDSRSQMEYIAEEGGYVKSVLLKEGYYNYLYVTQKDRLSPAQTATIEGDYYETENEYRAMVYFRPFGQRYDRLIGVQAIQTN